MAMAMAMVMAIAMATAMVLAIAMALAMAMVMAMVMAVAMAIAMAMAMDMAMAMSVVMAMAQVIKSTISIKTMTKTKYLYKFLAKGMESNYETPSGEQTWEIGKWYKYDGEIELHFKGFHASESIMDALKFSHHGLNEVKVLAKVEVRGAHQGKSVWSEMRVVKAWNWTKKDSVEIAIFAAEQVIHIYEKHYPNDGRPRKAIEAAKAWLKDPSEKNKNEVVKSATYATQAAYEASQAASYAAYAASRAAHTVSNLEDAALAESYAVSAYSVDAKQAAEALYDSLAIEITTNSETPQVYCASKLVEYAAIKEMSKKISNRVDKQFKKLTPYNNQTKKH